MSVVINDFEVIPEPAAAGPAEPTAPPPASQLNPDDVRRVLRRHCERLARVKAH